MWPSLHLKLKPIVSRKFGFVTYANDDAAKSCLEEKKMKSHKLDEKDIEVKRAMPRGNKDRNASLKTHKIFVGGLDTDVDEDTSKLNRYYSFLFLTEIVIHFCRK